MVDIATKFYPLIPLKDVVVYPHIVTPLFVNRPKSINALEQALLADDRLVVLSAQKEIDCDDPKQEDIYKIGTLAEVMQMLRLPDGTVKVLIEGVSRVIVETFKEEDKLIRSSIVKLDEVEQDDLITKSLIKIALEKFEQYVNTTKRINPESLLAVAGIGKPGKLADILATYLNLSVKERQACLEFTNTYERLEYISQLLSRELEVALIEQEIHDKVRFNLEKTQREYFLREKMKIIQEELISEDFSGDEITDYKNKVAKAKMSSVANEKALKEIVRLEKMMPQSSEASVIRSYLDTLIALPWDKKSKEIIDLKRAQKILDRDHYGLEKVKERIIEYLAVRKLSNEPLGTILCLVGPPGVGKTSLVKSIASSLNREFARISLGGVNDEAEIRGHRRTYIGAMPGRIIQALKQTQTKNPVILLDEIEKMTRHILGDPTAAMLEVLDPDQNENFTDNYVDAPFSLKEVIFVATANALDYVPRPLYDRLEVIPISGYTSEEKLNIAKLHIVPKTLFKHGLTAKQFKIPDESIKKIIQDYTREAGVRSLERYVAKLCRKVATHIVKSDYKSITITPSIITKYLGPAKILSDNDIQGSHIGIVTGLAWTQTGGETLQIEVNIMPGKGGLQLTGQLGDIMKESAQAAFTYIRSHSNDFGIEPNFQEKIDVHIHIPEGAIPKDGPSAGVALCVALMSAVTKTKIVPQIAMTGEITLRGRVLPIGGLKEKLLAALRAKIKTVIFPKANTGDLAEIPDYVKSKLNLIPVSSLDEVFDLTFKKNIKVVKRK